ncbi:hypothetical protein JTE90_017700 [Oedothorax gibbosus]|uniref:Secreted protein n=1 Tax=Oedothorax gibbosus TaxID=931172 RepID=A0AAV6U7Z0_9ARAC|nr:hypothetical protein JTE90_017700 [Oedothorax gibbosus]
MTSLFVRLLILIASLRTKNPITVAGTSSSMVPLSGRVCRHLLKPSAVRNRSFRPAPPCLSGILLKSATWRPS